MDALTKPHRQDPKVVLEKIFELQFRKSYEAAARINRAVFEGLDRRRPPRELK